MRLYRTKTPIPRVWATHPEAKGLLLEKDLGMRFGRLKAKLLVWDKMGSMGRFWEAAIGRKIGRSARGVVSGLCHETIVFCKKSEGGGQRSFIEADPRYFCVIGLVKGFLSMEVISHEAVHAGFAFAKRKGRTPWDKHALAYDEESVCYPAGRIAAAINRALHAANLY